MNYETKAEFHEDPARRLIVLSVSFNHAEWSKLMDDMAQNGHLEVPKTGVSTYVKGKALNKIKA